MYYVFTHTDYNNDISYVVAIISAPANVDWQELEEEYFYQCIRIEPQYETRHFIEWLKEKYGWVTRNFTEYNVNQLEDHSALYLQRHWGSRPGYDGPYRYCSGIPGVPEEIPDMIEVDPEYSAPAESIGANFAVLFASTNFGINGRQYGMIPAIRYGSVLDASKKFNQ